MVSEFQRFLQSIAGDILPQQGPAPAAPPPQQPMTGGFSPQLLAILNQAQRQASSQPMLPPAPPPPLTGVPSGTPTAQPQDERAAQQQRIAQGMQEAMGNYTVAPGPVPQGQGPLLAPVAQPQTYTPQPVAPQPQPAQPLPAQQQYVFVEYQTGGTEDTKLFFYVPVAYTETLPTGARILDDTPESDPARLGRASEMGMMFEQQDPSIQAVFATPETAGEAGPQQPIPSSAAPGAMPTNPNAPAGARPGTTPSGPVKPFAEQQAEQGNVVIGTDATGAPVYGKPGETYQSPYGPSPQQAQTYTTDELFASGDQDLMALAGRLEASGITSIREDQVVMTNPDTGKVYLATPDEIVKNDSPLSIEQVRQTDPEKAALMEQAGVQWIRPSEAIVQLPDGSVQVFTSDQIEELNRGEPVGTQLPPLSVSDIRTSQSQFAGMTGAQVAAGMDAANIAFVPQGQMLVRDQQGVFSLAPEDPNATTTDAQGRTVVLHGGESKPRVRMLYDPRDFDQWQDIYRTPIEIGKQIGSTALSAAAPLDWFRQQAVGLLGEAMYEAANLPDLGGWVPAAGDVINFWLERDPLMGNTPLGRFGQWAHDNGDILRDAYENGYNGYSGGRAVWERFVEEEPWYQRALGEIVLDPLNYATLGGGALSRAGARVLGSAEDITVTRRLVGEALRALGYTAKLPDAVMDNIVLQMAQPIGRGVRNLPGIGRALDLTPTQRVTNAVGGVNEAFQDLMIRERRNPQPLGQQTMPAPGTGPLAPTPGGGTLTPQGSVTGGTIIPRGRQAVVNGETVMTGRGPLTPTPEELQGGIPLTGAPDRRQLQGPSLAEVPVIPERTPGGGTLTPEGPVLEGTTPQRTAATRPELAPTPAEATGSAPAPRPLSELQGLSRTQQQAVRREELGLGPVETPSRQVDIQIPDHWDIAAPRAGEAGSRRIIDRALEAGQASPEQWQRFVQLHDDAASAYAGEQNILAAERGQRIQNRQPDWDIQRDQAFGEAEYIVNRLIPDLQASGFTVAPDWYQFRQQIRGNVSQSPDATLIERAVFGEGQEQVQAMTALNGRARAMARRGDNSMLDMYRTIRDELRPQYLSRVRNITQPTLPTTAAAPSTQATSGMLPMDQIRSTANMTREQLDAVGLPRLQPRPQAFSQQTVNDIVQNYNPDLFDPILVARGNDGNFYIVSGHSRYEGMRLRGETQIPARIAQGQGQALARTAEMANVVQTRPEIFQLAQQVREDLRGGLTHAEIGRARRLGDEAWAKGGTAAARDLENIAAIDPTSRLGELVGQGVIEPRTAAVIGQGIRNGSIDPADADRLAQRVMNKELRVKDVQLAVRDIAAGKVDVRTQGINELAGEVSKVNDAIELRKRLTRERNSLFNQRKAILDAAKVEGRDLTRGQQRKIAQLENEIRRVSSELGIPENRALFRSAKPDAATLAAQQADELRVSEPFEVGGETMRMQQVPETPPQDWLRPMTEEDAAAARARLEQAQMDVGAPQMRGGQQGTPGEALQGGDLLQQPERSAADVMRDSGSQSLFAVNDPRRTAESLYNRTLGRRVRNPMAERAADHPFVRMDDEPLQVARFRGRDLSVSERAVLMKPFADNGETIAARWERYANDLEQNGIGTGKKRRTFTAQEAEHEAAARVIKDFAVERLRENTPNKYKLYEEELARLTAKGGDTASNQAKALDFAWRDGKKGKSGMDVYDTVLAVMREGALYNTLTGPRYILTQAVGNALTLLLTGNIDVLGEALNARNYRAALSELRTGARDVQQLFVPMELATTPGVTRQGVYGPITEGMDDLPVAVTHDSTDRMLAELDLANVRNDIGHLNRDQLLAYKEGLTGDYRYRRLRTHEVADSLRLGRNTNPKFAKATTWWANEHVRNFANAFDLSYRKALYAHTMQAQVADARQAFYRWMEQNLPSPGDKDTLDQLWDELPQVFGSDRVRFTFDAIDPTYADRMARDWQSAIGRMDTTARDEVRRVFFSGDETNADAFLRRVIFFHYWMSRATPLYVEGLMRNPGLLNAYIKMMTEMKEQAESGEYGSAVKGFLYVMSTGLGYNIFIRPDAFIQTFMSFANQSNYSPEGENLFGKFMRQTGLFFNPLVDTVVNISGMQGDTFAPDPLMLGQWTGLVQRALDLGKAHGFISGDTPTGNKYQDVMVGIRSGVSGTIPGTNEIPYRDSTAFARRDINELIYVVAEEQGIEPDDPRVLAAMDDPESALYQEAFRRYATNRGIEQLVRVVPGPNLLFPKLRMDAPDERRAQINDRATPLEEREALQDQQQMALIGNPQARALEIQQREMQELGTEEQQAAYDIYNGLRYGGLDEPVKVNGVWIRERQLAYRTADERQAIADQWARENGQEANIQHIRDLRAAYRDAHPEIAAYTDWRNSVSDYDGGPIAYWEALSRGNPNAARYYESLETLPMDELEGRLTSITAYMAVQGIQQNVYEPNPIATMGNGAVYTPTPPGGGEQGYPQRDPAESIRMDIADYQQQTAMLDAQTQAMFGVRASDLEGMNPMARSAYEQRMQSAGMQVPRLSGLTQDYLQWAAGQPPGSDISPEAFVRWRDAYMQQNGMEVGPASGEMILRMLGR